MLRSLHIENYVLIKSLDLDFTSGFSVITGETGAGKSILLGALGLVLGNRADLKTISDGQEKCVIEAVFDISNYNIRKLFEDNDLDYYDECIFRRELLRNGKSRLFLNDTPVNISILKAIGDELIDIHSQHSNLLLKDDSFQLSVLDCIAENKDIRNRYREIYNKHSIVSKLLKDTIALAASDKKDLNYIEFQYKQLCDAKLRADELPELESDLLYLEHASELKTALAQTEDALLNETGAISLLRIAENQTQTASNFQSELQALHDRISSCTIELKDIADDISKRCELIEMNPERLEQVRERLDLIYTLLQKHKVANVSELLDLQKVLEDKISELNYSDENIAKLKQEENLLNIDLQKIASTLSESRKNTVKKIESHLTASLSNLGIPNANFVIKINTTDTPSRSGIDKVSFLFSANKSQKPQAVAQIASGGEISRLMLCIKAMIAKSENLPTLIFDEIDTGISGEIAAKMGNILKEMGLHSQIICITHLPQIAAKGSIHYMVYKKNEDGTETHVKLLDQNERIEEIAKMLSGTAISSAAIENAQDLLNNN
ncbi:MAG: DNA repair protein RecN [Bacteroidia bacterium]|nr:DNA repair protein RecN [Bacteroidia bacterium]